jgi:glycosyltransferase involved in cell wall biosynthesis
MAKTGHEFYSIHHPQFRTWNTQFRPYPPNYFKLDGVNIQDQLKVDMSFDIVLSQNKFGQYQVMYQLAHSLACPFVSLEHTLPVPQWDTNRRAQLSQMRGDINVFITDYSIDQWQFQIFDPTVQVIEHGIDTNFFSGWKGEDGKILTVVNDYINRDWCCGFNLYRQITQGLPINPWGGTPGLSQPTRDHNHLREIYRGASVFLNTSQISPIPSTLLEAMSTGCPVVTTETCAIPSIVEDGVNGYISNDPAILRKRLVELLKNPGKAKELGENARKTIVDRFGQQRFVNEWNELFKKVANGPSLTWAMENMI